MGVSCPSDYTDIKLSLSYHNHRNRKMSRIELPIVEHISAWSLDLKSTRNTVKKAKASDEVIIPMNSYGGSVLEGTAFCTILKDSKATTVCEILGVSASMGTIIAISCDKVVMPTNGYFMIHNPSMWTSGESKVLKRGAQMLDTMKAAMVSEYVRKSGQPEATIIEMMDEETWLTGQEALDLGFVDELSDEVTIDACYKPGEFQNTPEALIISEEADAAKETKKPKGAFAKFLAASKEFFGSEDLISETIDTLTAERDDAISQVVTMTAEIDTLNTTLSANAALIEAQAGQAETITTLEAEIQRLKESAAANPTIGAEGDGEGGGSAEMLYDPITQAAIDRKNA